MIWGEDQQSVSFLLENMARLDVRRSNIPDFSSCRKIWRRVCMRSLSLTTACRCCMPSPAPIFLCQYNSIIASLWQYNCYHCELGENLKLYSCLVSMRAPDNMYYSLSGCSTISYCSLFCNILQNWCTNIVSFYEILQQWQFVIGTITTWYYCTN